MRAGHTCVNECIKIAKLSIKYSKEQYTYVQYINCCISRLSYCNKSNGYKSKSQYYCTIISMRAGHVCVNKRTKITYASII